MNSPSKPARLLATATVTAALAACVGQPVPAQATSAPATSIQATSARTSVAPVIPETPAGRQLSWLLDAAGRTPIADSELAAHFAAGFLENIPAAQINQVLANFKDMRLEQIARSQERALVARIVAGGAPYEVVLSVDGAGLIDGLRFRAPTPERPAPKSWAELDERLRKVAPQTGFVAAEVTRGGDCRPAHAVAHDTARPLGSMVKLYVLGAVAERIRSGAFGWDTQLTVTPEVKSLPSGQLQDRPDHSKVSVLEAARLMISISDNTATDLLIHKVGRKRVERTMRAWGAPDKRNVPLLTTREMFVLKGADHPKHAKRYLSLRTAGKRAYLKEVVAEVPLSAVKPWTQPRELDTIEWYGSPADVCEAYARLAKLRDPRVGEVMSINDAGLGLDRGRWPAVWYKGGSEPGVLDLSFLARTSGGRTYVVTAMAVDPGAPMDEGQAGTELLALVRGAFALAEGS
ncbi:serine hydrolase [Nonomuraea sp. SYSU D8015]|uniref:serine hydrolase n=1 Tax=Nonomuraea sp. SYSU D8015 TaxID=2593644 RepID=UPI001660B0B2|nr:serine hydrolase [Nonomuraea sp. SYSU D8015]